MVIPPNNIGKGSGVPTNQSDGIANRNDAASTNKGAGVGKEAAATDAVSLSSHGQKLARLEASVNQHSEVNEARVDALKQAVDSGRYQVDSQSVAKKMLDIDRYF